MAEAARPIRERSRSGRLTSERDMVPLGKIVLVLLAGFLQASDQLKMHYIHWNSSNPIFSSGRSGGHTIDIGLGDGPWEYHQANIICPYYPDDDDQDRMEKFVIYNVTESEYERCRLDGNNDKKIVALCDTPRSHKYFTLTFRPFSPTPGGFEFREGRDYFFISTRSIGERRCSSRRMRIRLRMRNKEEDEDDKAGESEEPSLYRDYGNEEEEEDSALPVTLSSSGPPTTPLPRVLLMCFLCCSFSILLSALS